MSSKFSEYEGNSAGGWWPRPHEGHPETVKEIIDNIQNCARWRSIPEIWQIFVGVCQKQIPVPAIGLILFWRCSTAEFKTVNEEPWQNTKDGTSSPSLPRRHHPRKALSEQAYLWQSWGTWWIYKSTLQHSGMMFYFVEHIPFLQSGIILLKSGAQFTWTKIFIPPGLRSIFWRRWERSRIWRTI